MCTKSTLIFCGIFFGTFFLIFGIPMWFMGCNDAVGAQCVNNNKYNALVVSNTCYETHGSRYDGKDDDDTIGNNCNVHVKYIKNEIEHICPIYRSTSDNCRYLVTSQRQTEKCLKLNREDYQIGKNITIYINKYDKTCYSSHFIKKLGTDGFKCIIFGLILVTIPIVFILNSNINTYKTDRFSNSYQRIPIVELANINL